MENIIDPNNKCGYESLWIGFKNVKNQTLIDKYNLTQMTDLYKLLRYGTEDYPSLFEEDNIKKMIKTMCSNKDITMFEDFKNERFNKNKGAVWKCYFLLVAIYFNIEIILMDKDKNELKELSNKIKDTLNILKLKPNEKIRLHLTPNHVEYLPQNNEIEIFENLKKNITIKKDIYDELEFIKLIENTRDYDTDDSYTMDDLEIDFNI